MRRVVFGAALMLLACQPKKPDHVLSTEKMTEIITDLQLAEVAYKMDLLPAVYKNKPEKYFIEVLATHQTDTAIYNQSLHYYAENPKLLLKIYNGVEQNILKK
jgi:hypothetical protein